MKIGDKVRRNIGSGYNDGLQEGDEGVVMSFDGNGIYVKADKSGKIGWHCKEYLAVVAPATTGLRIEAGKFYKMRDGRKVGPLSKYDIDSWECKNIEWAGLLWRNNGQRYYRDNPEGDLIAEWVDERVDAGGGFKAGDRIRLISNPSGDSNIGDEYTAVARSSASMGASGSVHFRDKSGDVSWRPGSYFELVKPQPAIVCLIENDQPKPATRPYVHADRASANKEANRLAGQHKSQEFGVYELVSTAKQERVYDHQWQNTAKAGLKIEAIKQLRAVAGIGLKAAKDAVEDWLTREAA